MGNFHHRSMKRLFIAYMLFSFAFVAACFVWLAATNAGNPQGVSGGTVVDFLPPAEWIKIGVGQVFAVVGIYALVPNPGAGVLNDWIPGDDRSGRMRTTLAYLTPLAIGSALVIWGIVGLIRWYGGES